MNDRHPSGTAHAPASAPDAASAGHDPYLQVGQQGDYAAYDSYATGSYGTGSYPTADFASDPLFGDMPGSEYETGQWSQPGTQQSVSTPASGHYDPYAAQQAAHGTGSYDTTGAWAASQQPAGFPAQAAGPEVTGQWQAAQPFDPQAFDAAGFAVQTGQFETGQFETGTYDPSGYASVGYETQGYEASGYDAQGLGGQGHSATGYENQGFDAQTYGGQGFSAQGYENQGYDGQDYPSAGYAAPAHESLPPQNPEVHPHPEAYDALSYGTGTFPAAVHEAQNTAVTGAYGTTEAFEAVAAAAYGTAGGAYDATDPLNPTGSYETTGFDTATFEAIYEAPAYPEELPYETAQFTSAGDDDPAMHETGAHQPLPHESTAHACAPDEAPHQPGHLSSADSAGDDADFADGDNPWDIPVVAAQHPSPASSRSRNRRRTASKRSALLTVAVPSACVMGVAGIAAASVGDFADGGSDAKASAPDVTSVKPSVANSKLDTQLQGLSADAGDFADRASRTQERIDLKAEKEAARKRAAEEAERKERLRPKFALPVDQHGLSAYYGQAGVNWMSVHSGIDFPVAYGTPVMAATDGTVRTQYNIAYGNMAIVTAKDGTETWYCHLSSHKVFSGEVKAGDVIANSGNSGNSTGPHLHFEVRPGGGSAINPLPWLQSHGLDPQ